MLPADFQQRLSRKRLAKVPRYVGICGLMWSAFAIYFCATGRSWSMWLCVVVSLATFGLIVVGKRKRKYLEPIAHLNLFLAGCGIIVESIVSCGIDSCSSVFLCGFGVLAAHQLGIRAALAWTAAAMVGVVIAFYGCAPESVPVYRIPSHFDKIAMFTGLTAVLYWLSHQAERSFEKQVAQLIFFADGLQERTRLLSLAEQTAEVGHWQWNLENETLRLSAEACRMCGLDVAPDEEIAFAEFAEHLSSSDRRRLRNELAIGSEAAHEFSVDLEVCNDSSVRYVKCRGFSVEHADGEIRSLFGVLKDETSSHRAQQELLDLATRDPLTQLPNRHSFQLYLQESLRRADDDGSQVAILVADMNGFKQINDTLGHPTGDVILKTIGQRLQESVGDECYVARLGGDEFVIVMRDFRTRLDLSIFAGKVARHVSRPYHCRGKQLHVSASIGAAIYPTDTTDPDELLSFADTAMYKTKGSGDAVRLYEPSMTTDLVKRHELENRLATALEDNEFSLLFQPQVRMSDQRLIGFESLVRWNRDGEVISPYHFIALLESTGRIIEVGRWILHESCRQAKEWVDAGYDIAISVNVSPVQFSDPNFVPYVWSALEQTGLPPERLDLELTESVLVDEIDEITSKLDLIKTTGSMISIDDFGTGYSSLAYLKHLPIDRLKIDRAFIKDIPEGDDGTIAKSMIMMATALGLTVLAEGVETESHLDFLRLHGCDEYQGYLYSKPLKPEDALTLLGDVLDSPKPTAIAAPIIVDTDDSDVPSSVKS